MNKITSLVQTHIADPTEWEGIDGSGNPIYIRYKWGYLSIRKGT